MKTYYVTKYSLTKGIYPVEGTTTQFDSTSSYVQFKNKNNYPCCFKLDKDIFSTIDGAVADAEHRRLKKIKSLEKQIAKLKALKQDNPENTLVAE